MNARRTRLLLLAPLALGLMIMAVSFGQKKDPGPKAEELKPLLTTNNSSVHGYWKGNLHTHTLWSDGDDFPEMVADWYKTKGYHFLSLTDHNVLSDGTRFIEVSAKNQVAMEKYLKRFGPTWVEQMDIKDKQSVRLKPLREFRSLLEEPNRFLLIQGEEVTASYVKAPVHINGINLRDVLPAMSKGASLQETISANVRAINEQGKKTGWKSFAIVNHPNYEWSTTAEQMIEAEEIKFFEVFNGHPGVKNYGDATRPGMERMWDIILSVRLGKKGLPLVYGVATDDAHKYHEYGVGKTNPGRGWVMVQAKQLTAENISNSMNKGQFYSTSGVILKEVSSDGGKLTIEIDAQDGVTYKTQFIATMKNASLDSKPALDKDGKELPITRTYSDDIGKVVAEIDGPKGEYKLTGNELYVRAKIISTKPHPNPYAKGDVETAWTQPVVPGK